jgi:hypothetical protein
MSDRTFEIGLHAGAGFSNDFLTVRDVFQESAVIDLDELKEGFQMNIALDIIPFHFSFNRDNNWGFGLSLGADAIGILNLSGNMITFGEAENEQSEIRGAAFAYTQGSGFFHFQRFRIKTNASVFVPLIYVTSDVSYTYKQTQGSTIFDIDYNLKIFAATPLGEDGFSLTARPGFDLHLGVEYPLAEVLGLSETFGFLDFIVGMDLINIPIFRAQMKNYMGFSGRIGGGEFDFSEDGFDGFFNMEDTENFEGNISVMRPFKMLLWADWKPFGIVPLSFIPTLGFSINPLYNQLFSMECGIKVRYDLLNIFIATLGIGYHDRLWKNSIDLALNLRAVELNLGFDLRSPEFLKSWAGGGYNVSLGLKFGW